MLREKLYRLVLMVSTISKHLNHYGIFPFYRSFLNEAVSSTDFVDEQFSDIDGKTLLREGYKVNQCGIIQQF